MAKSADTITVKNNAWKAWLVGFFVLLMYTPSLLWMWDRWFARDSYYSHGILIPFISAYLLWLKKDSLKKIPWESAPWGRSLFFAGIAIHLISALFRVYFTSGFSMILVFMGLTAYFYGARVLKQVLFPIGFLIFMVPLPLVVITNLSFRLKIMAAQIAVAALHNMGFPCLQHGSTIIMRHAYVVVDDVCSGLRSLITLMALGSLFAYGMNSSGPKKLILMASTIPIAVAANVLRIIFLAAGSEIWGTGLVEGPIHPLSGFIVFAGAFGLLYAVQKSME